MRTFITLITAALLSLPTAQARGPEIDISRIPYQKLFEMTSTEGESLQGFLLRVGGKLRAYSDETGLEACGSIATDGTRYGIVVGTSQSHLACVIYHKRVPEGMTSIREGIHSHGGNKEFTQNRSDKIFMGVGDDARSGYRAKVYGQDLNQFSDTDFHGGKGYLATETGVIYHSGNHKVEVVRDEKSVAVASN